MSEEKMLIKVEKIGMFQRISNFIRKLFYKSKENEIYTATAENDYTNNLIKELEEKRKTIEIQKKYESNNLKEEELTEEEKEKLIALYKEQIETLERNITNYQQNLKVYRNKIIEMKNKVNSN